MPVVGTPGFQDGVQIPAVSLLDSYHKALAFSWVGCKSQEMGADSTVALCPASVELSNWKLTALSFSGYIHIA